MQPLLHPLAAWIEANAPAKTAAAVGPIEEGEPFDHVEAAAMARAVKARRDEFHTGRRLARAALARLGCAPTPIPVGENRVPVWPPGLVGTISHSRTLCAAHLGFARDLLGIGIDLELDAPVSSDLAERICRPDEKPVEVDAAVLLRFVAKEAFFKAYFPLARTFLDFHDVRVEFDLQTSAFVADIVTANKPMIFGQRTFAGRFSRLSDHLVAALWILR